MGAVSQLHPPACRWLVFGVEEKEKWERGGWIYLRRRKGNFTLVSLHDRCPPAKPVICPSRVVPLFSEAAVTDHLLSFSAFPLMVPPVVHMRKLKPWTDTVGFVESRQACDEAASRYQQDPGRLIGASDTDPGKETKRWPLRAPSVSTLPCLTWTRLMGWTSWIRCVFFFFSPQSEKIKQELVLSLPLSVWIFFTLVSPSSPLFSSSSSSSVPPFSTKTRVIWWNKSSSGPVWPLHHGVNEPRWCDDHTEVREAQNWERWNQGKRHLCLRLCSFICRLMGTFTSFQFVLLFIELLIQSFYKDKNTSSTMSVQNQTGNCE